MDLLRLKWFEARIISRLVIVLTTGSISTKEDNQLERLALPACGAPYDPRANVCTHLEAVPSVFEIHCDRCNVEAWRECGDRPSTPLLLFL